MSKPVHYINKLQRICKDVVFSKDRIVTPLDDLGILTPPDDLSIVVYNIKQVYYSSFPIKIEYMNGVIKEHYFPPILMRPILIPHV